MKDRLELAELLPNWWELLDRDECPRCGKPLDTGWECAVVTGACGYDAQPLVESRMAKLDALRARAQESKP